MWLCVFVCKVLLPLFGYFVFLHVFFLSPRFACFLVLVEYRACLRVYGVVRRRAIGCAGN